jgi:hypothetical protein
MMSYSRSFYQTNPNTFLGFHKYNLYIEVLAYSWSFSVSLRITQTMVGPIRNMGSPIMVYVFISIGFKGYKYHIM